MSAAIRSQARTLVREVEREVAQQEDYELSICTPAEYGERVNFAESVLETLEILSYGRLV